MWADGVMGTVTVVAEGQEEDDCFLSTVPFRMGAHDSVDNGGGIRAGLFFRSSPGTCVRLHHSDSTEVDCQVHVIRWTSAG